MANWRLTMRKIKEILRLRYEAGRSIRQISCSAGISVGSIQKLLEKSRTVAVELTTAGGDGRCGAEPAFVPGIVRWCTG